MEPYTFHAYGHPNITALHPTTLEITKDAEMSLRGDCIIGVKANYDLLKVKELLSSHKKLNMVLQCNDIVDQIAFESQESFDDTTEMVIRLTGFGSPRTAGIYATKAAKGLSRALIDLLKKSDSKFTITIRPI